MFLLIASGGLLLFYRQAMVQRHLRRGDAARESEADLLSAIQQTGSSLGGMVERLDRVLPKSQAEVSVIEKRLIRAGYREESAVKVFYGAKVLVPLTLCLIAVVTDLRATARSSPMRRALGLGFLLPDFWLGRQISKRQKEIRLGLPDALDFLVICIEAGLSHGPGDGAHRGGAAPGAAGDQR